MNRGVIALVCAILLGMPIVGYAGAQLVLGRPLLESAAAVAPEPVAAVEAGGIGLPPGKRLVETISIGDDIGPLIGKDDAIVVAQAGARSCLPWQSAIDGDGDFNRNADRFAVSNLCVTERRFHENRVDWIVHVIDSGRPGPLWAVPHDDEDVAFDSGLWAVATYGGRMVSVETGGERLNDGIDPSRNFTGNATACGRYSPRFTELFTEGRRVIVGLHSNDPGGFVSVKGTLDNTTAFKAQPRVNPYIEARSDDDTLVFVASLAPQGEDRVTDRIVQVLVGNGINVMREHVSAESNDCSLSNYVALHQLPRYFNVEVLHGDGNAQRRLISLLMKL